MSRPANWNWPARRSKATALLARGQKISDELAAFAAAARARIAEFADDDDPTEPAATGQAA